MHDDSLERTSSGHGAVAMHTLTELAILDAGSWLSPRFAGESIPTLDTTAVVCLAARLWANLEIKPCPGREEETGRVVGRVAARLWHGSDAPPLLSSFSPSALEAARAAAPDLARGLLVTDVSEDALKVAADLRCASIHCHYRNVTSAVVTRVHDAGFALLCYTVNDPDIGSRLRLAGVDCIVTDRLDLFQPA
jgi:glycerophosphoryl diester phosphodiesterase